jgi:hypothetical protein
VVVVVVAQLERKMAVFVVQMDHLEDLGNIDAFDSLLEALLGVENDVFPVESVIKQVR